VLLVDTSLWVEVFRRPPHIDLPVVAPIEDIVTCLPIIQEVLQGFRDEPAFRTAREAMLAFPVVESPLRLDLFLDAVGLYRSARRAGLTVRSGVDCLIAACAIRHDLTVLHRDRDFPALASVSPLKQRSAGAA
jgi:predicted nucleic acid-binding protein